MGDPDIPYKPLNLPRKEIRLFHIEIATEEELRISTRIVSLPDKPEYDCISYVCGPQQPKVPILVDGQPMDITVNLAAVLRYFGAEGDNVWLWADAICINQADNKEKSHQVQLMSEIFTAAAQVRAWIRPITWWAPEGINLDRETVLHLEEACGIALEWFTTPREAVPPIAEISHEGMSDIILAFYYLVADPFWHRMWITQELILNDNVKIHYGSLHFTFFGHDKFLLLLKNANRCNAALSALLKWGIETTEEGDEARERLRTRIEGDDEGLALIGDVVFRLCQSESLYNNRGSKHTSQLRSYSLRFPRRRVYAERKHDYVYAMLGLAGDELKIEVDYDKAYQEVFADFTLKSIRWLGNLDPVLEAMWHHDGFRSWVVDYSQISDDSRYRLGRLAIFYYSADEGVPFDVEESHGTLFVQGIMPDVIQHVSQDFDPSDAGATTFSAASNFYHSARAKAGMEPLTSALPVELVRTILLDVPELNKDVFEAYQANADIRGFRETRLRLTADEVSQWTQAFSGRVEDMNPSVRTTMFSRAKFMNSKCLFLTKAGRLGVADGNIRNGDEICVFGGCPMPLAVRSQAGSNSYELISALYVDEMMDGQALEICIDQVLDEDGTTPLRRLAIV